MAKSKRVKGKWTGSSLVSRLHEEISASIEVTKKGDARLKRAAVRETVDSIFEEVALRAASGRCLK